MFTKGHTINKGSNRGGRKKTPDKLLQEAWDKAAKDYPQLVKTYMNLATDGMHEALFIYISNRLLGIPKQTIDSNIKGAILTLSSNDYDTMARELMEHTAKLGETEKIAPGECGRVRLIQQESIKSNINTEESGSSVT